MRGVWMIGLVIGLAATSARAGFDYTDFSSTAGITLVGDAAVASGDRLRITPSVLGQVGAAWVNDKQSIAGGFQTDFRFQISNLVNTGSDGFAFVIQNNSTTALGSGGGVQGFGNIPNVFALEFDSYQNAVHSDPSGDHIALMTSHEHSDQVGPAIVNAAMGTAIHTIRIVYVPGTITVYYDDLINPAITASVDLAGLHGGNLLDGSGYAYVGFTGATGGGYQNQDILDWSFTPEPTTAMLLLPGLLCVRRRRRVSITHGAAAHKISNAAGSGALA